MTTLFTRTAWVIALTAAAANAEILARFDAGDTDPAQSLQSTFTGIGIPNAGTGSAAVAGPLTATSGSITLRLTNGLTTDGSGDFNSTGNITPRDRGTPSADAGSFTYKKLYRDFLTQNVLGIELSGLAANTSYALTFYAYDNSGGRTQTFTDITPGGTGNSGTVTYTSGFNFASSTNDVFATTFNATSDANGHLFFSETGVGNTNVAVFNGLVVDGIPAIDVTPPTLAGNAIADDRAGGPVAPGSLVTYTVTFSEDMDATTVTTTDFANAGTAAITIGSITETSPGVFSIQVTPSSAGTLQLQVVAGASLRDVAGNSLDTTTAITSTTVLTVNAVTDPSGVRHLYVFLIGGQSNADGRASVSELPTSPVNLQQAQPDVDFYDSTANSNLTTLQPLVSVFGPELTLGRTLADSLGSEPGTRVAIIKWAVGGTTLYSDWVAGGDATTTGDGTRYVNFQGSVSTGMAKLAATYPGAQIEIKGMLWVQGESDAGAQAVNYQTNLTNFIADIRLTYGPNLWFIISRLSNVQTAVNPTGLPIIRAAQEAVAAADPLAALLDTDGFGTNSDHLHFNGAGQQAIGNGAAKWLLDFQPFLKMPEITRQPGGSFAISVSSAFPGFRYALQANPDLQPGNWVDLDTVVATSPAVNFTHTPAPGTNRMFYRVGRSIVP